MDARIKEFADRIEAAEESGDRSRATKKSRALDRRPRF